MLTERLAPRCGQLLSIDVSEQALAQARERCARLPQVRFERRYLPDEFPAETFDLILISEVGYYLSLPDLRRLRARCFSQLKPRGHLLLVHWTPPVHDYPLTGDAVHDEFLAAAKDERLLHKAGQRADPLPARSFRAGMMVNARRLGRRAASRRRRIVFAACTSIGGSDQGPVRVRR